MRYAFFAALLGVVSVHQAVADVLIDDFNVDQSVNVTGNGSDSDAMLSGAGVLNDSGRTISVNVMNSGAPASSASLTMNVTPGTFSMYDYSQGGFPVGGPLPSSSFSLLYSDLGGVTGNPMTDAFYFDDLFYSSAAPLILTFIVNGTSAASVVVLPGNSVGYTLPLAAIPFASFSDTTVFTSGITTLEIRGNLSSGSKTFEAERLRIDVDVPEFDLPSVPEPSTLALACMGLAGFGGYARRRMKARA